MEEKIVKKEDKVEEKSNKLTYEQLSAYANQTAMQAQKIYNENMQLKQALNDIQRNINLKEIELALKCVEMADRFSTDFIYKIVSRIEDLLTPDEKVDNQEVEEEK